MSRPHEVRGFAVHEHDDAGRPDSILWYSAMRTIQIPTWDDPGWVEDKDEHFYWGSEDSMSEYGPEVTFEWLALLLGKGRASQLIDHARERAEAV